MVRPARTLASTHHAQLVTLYDGIYHCLPWVDIRKGGIGFRKPKWAQEDERFLATWIVIDQKDDGRFGTFLYGNVDWALSRERGWGTPLNVWECAACQSSVAPESIKALEETNPKAVEKVYQAPREDPALALDIRCGPERGDPFVPARRAAPFASALQNTLPRLRVGFSTASPIGTPVHPEAVAAVQAAARLLERLGHDV